VMVLHELVVEAEAYALLEMPRREVAPTEASFFGAGTSARPIFVVTLLARTEVFSSQPPKMLKLCLPPGAAWTRVEGRSVMVLQEFVVDEEAYALLEIPRLETPAVSFWCTGAAGCCGATAWGAGVVFFRPFLLGGSA